MEAFKYWLFGKEAGEYTSLHFEFDTLLGTPVVLLILLAAAAGAVYFWWPRLKHVPQPVRYTLTGLRVFSMLLVLFLVFDPSIVARQIKASKHYVAVLFDDSQSMRIVGPHGVSRGERLLKAYHAHRADFEDKLKQTHQVALYRFGDQVDRLRKAASLTFDRHESDITGAIQGALRQLEGVNVSAVVLFSDGVQQTRQDMADIDKTIGKDVPVFAVGTDTESAWRDLELADMTVTRTNFDKSPVAVTVRAGSTGLAGEKAIAEVLDGNHVVASAPFTIGGNAEEDPVRLQFVPTKKDWLEYVARVRLADTGPADRSIAVENIALPGKDRVTANNSRSFLVDNREKTYRILYFSGRPNWENKFVRRALEEDPQLKMASLIRISGKERKFEYRGRKSSLSNPLYEGFDTTKVNAPRYDEAVFIRLGLKKDELANGYPMDPAELYPFDLVIWGDIEREFFDQKHLELTRDFVAKRGGSFLLFGGPRAFAEGHYAGTIIETMLPVMLDPGAAQRQTDKINLFHAVPSVEGFLSGMWALNPDAKQNQAIWNNLPKLAGVNRFPMTRAGGTVMARVASEGSSVDGQPLFVTQRYGEGTCAVLATGETWQWHMETARDKDVHGRFWRQLVRGLVKDVPEPVQLQSRTDALTVGQPMRLRFLIRDKLFTAREGLDTTIQVTAPGAQAADLPVEESIEDPGVYEVELTPQKPGPYVLNVNALDSKGAVVGTLEKAVLAHPDNREYQGARFNPGFLKQLAKKSGGAYFTLNQLGDVARHIPWPEDETSEVRRIHLWHFPLFFFLVAAVLATEWYLRRRNGQA